MAAEYFRPLPYMSATRIRRFWRDVQIGAPEECWPWLGNRDGEGYGKVMVNRQSLKPHRIAYYLHYGVDPGKLMVCHRCDNKPCCNPLHFFLGTNSDNIRDMYRKGKGNQGEQHAFRRNPGMAKEAAAKRDPAERAETLAKCQAALLAHPERRARGARHGRAKFTTEQIQEIRRSYEDASPKYGLIRTLAVRFGVTRQTIRAIVHGRRYLGVVVSDAMLHWEQWVEPGC